MRGRSSTWMSWVPSVCSTRTRRSGCRPPFAEEADRHRPGWRERGPDGVRIVEPSAKVLAAVRTRVGPGLHPGEVAALAVWSTHKDASILCDDLAARRTAAEFGAPVLGTLGIVLRAVRLGRVAPTEGIELVAAIPTATTLHIRAELVAQVLRDLRGWFGPAEVHEPRIPYGPSKRRRAPTALARPRSPVRTKTQ